MENPWPGTSAQTKCLVKSRIPGRLPKRTAYTSELVWLGVRGTSQLWAQRLRMKISQSKGNGPGQTVPGKHGTGQCLPHHFPPGSEDWTHVAFSMGQAQFPAPLRQKAPSSQIYCDAQTDWFWSLRGIVLVSTRHCLNFTTGCQYLKIRRTMHLIGTE